MHYLHSFFELLKTHTSCQHREDNPLFFVDI